MEHEGEDTDNILILDLGYREERERGSGGEEQGRRGRGRRHTFNFVQGTIIAVLQVDVVPGYCNEK